MMMQRMSSAKKIRPTGVRSSRGLLPSGRSSSLSRLSGASQGSRFSDASGRGLVKDPRPTGEADFQRDCACRIVAFASHQDYKATRITERSLRVPSMKDFFSLFEFFYDLLRNNFKFMGKPEDEVIKIIKLLRYPFIINKTSLIGLGNRHSWGQILGLLVWMIDLIEFVFEDTQNQKFFEDGAEEFAGSGFNELVFEGIAESYRQFLQTAESDDRKDLEMFHNCAEEFMGTSNLPAIQRENEELVAQCENLQRKFQDHKMKEEMLQRSEQECEKLQQYFSKMDIYLTDRQERCNSLATEIAEIEAEIAPSLGERDQLNLVLKQQVAEANSLKLALARKEAVEERLKAARTECTNLENSVTDKEVMYCKVWTNIQKLNKEHEEIHPKTLSVLKEIDMKVATKLPVQTIRVKCDMDPAALAKDLDRMTAQTLSIVPILNDLTAEVAKAGINVEGTLKELNDYLNGLKQRERDLDSTIRTEKQKSSEIETEYQQQCHSLEHAIKELDLKAEERKVGKTKIMDVMNKKIHDLETKLAEVKKELKEDEEEKALVLRKIRERVKSYMEEIGRERSAFYQHAQKELKKLENLLG